MSDKGEWGQTIAKIVNCPDCNRPPELVGRISRYSVGVQCCHNIVERSVAGGDLDESLILVINDWNALFAEDSNET